MRLRTRLRRALPRRQRQHGWRKVKRRPLFTCGACGKRHSNPLGHTCSSKGDFGKRKRAAARAAATAERRRKREAHRRRVNDRVAAVRKRERARAGERVRRERQKAAERVRKARAARKPARRSARPAHSYQTCRDQDCQRIACEAYRQGLDDGDDTR